MGIATSFSLPHHIPSTIFPSKQQYKQLSVNKHKRILWKILQHFIPLLKRSVFKEDLLCRNIVVIYTGMGAKEDTPSIYICSISLHITDLRDIVLHVHGHFFLPFLQARQKIEYLTKTISQKDLLHDSLIYLYIHTCMCSSMR